MYTFSPTVRIMHVGVYRPDGRNIYNVCVKAAGWGQIKTTQRQHVHIYCSRHIGFIRVRRLLRVEGENSRVEGTPCRWK